MSTRDKKDMNNVVKISEREKKKEHSNLKFSMRLSLFKREKTEVINRESNKLSCLILFMEKGWIFLKLLFVISR